MTPAHPVSIITAEPPSIWNFLSPLSAFRNLWHYRRLILQMAWREVLARYRGTYLGILWSFLNPVLMLAVYTLVFSGIFRARWHQSGDANHLSFALNVFAGLVAFNIFSETVARSPALILNNVNYVKKVVFPLEILTVITLLSALIHTFISMAVLLIAAAALQGGISPAIAAVPLVLVPIVLWSLGLSWLLASLGVFLRDIGYGVALGLQILLFVSPIFYPLDAIRHEGLRAAMALNPLAISIEAFRSATLNGSFNRWEAAGWSAAAGFVMMQLGYAWFMRTKRAFADVI